MRKTILTLVSAVAMVLASYSAFALSISLTLETKSFSSEAAAIKEAKRVVAEINAGKNADAIADATLECPEENNPRFRVNWVQTINYLIPVGADFEKRYAARVDYQLRCQTRG